VDVGELNRSTSKSLYSSRVRAQRFLNIFGQWRLERVALLLAPFWHAAIRKFEGREHKH
jgi:hypothetical protein